MLDTCVCVSPPESTEPLLCPGAVVHHVTQHLHGLFPQSLLSRLPVLLLLLRPLHFALSAVPPPWLQHLVIDAASVQLVDAGPVAPHPAAAVHVPAVDDADFALGVLVHGRALFALVVGHGLCLLLFLLHTGVQDFGLGEGSDDVVVEVRVGVAGFIAGIACGQPG